MTGGSHTTTDDNHRHKESSLPASRTGRLKLLWHAAHLWEAYRPIRQILPASTGQHFSEAGISRTEAGSVKWYRPFGEQWRNDLQSQVYIMLSLTHSTLRYFLKRKGKIHIQENITQSNFINNSLKLEAIQMSNRSIDWQYASIDGILVCSKRNYPMIHIMSGRNRVTFYVILS